MYDEQSNADLWWSDVKGRLIRAPPQSAGRLDFCWANGKHGGSWRPLDESYAVQHQVCRGEMRAYVFSSVNPAPS